MNTNGVLSAIERRFRAIGLGAAIGLATALPTQAAVDIASVPLFLTASVDPNLMFILDDSGSMQFEVMPDEFIYSNINVNARYVFPRANGIYGGGDYYNRVPTVDDDEPYNALMRSPQVNTLYYNPSVTYTPWTRHDGSLYPAATPECALHNPERTGACPTGTTSANSYARNLTVDNGNYNSNRWYSCTKSGASVSCSYTTGSRTFWPAVYFWHNGGDIWTWGNYTKVEILPTTTSYTGHGRESRGDCAAAPTCTYAEEMQNFANWYTYYRSRVLAARAGIGKAFAEQGEGMRVGFAAINKGSTTIDGVSTGTIIRGVRPFSGSDRIDFFDLLYGHIIPNEGTPLRRALNDVGLYFSRTDNRGPWGAMPGTNNSSAHLQCRQNFSILMTDGYWSEGSTYQASTSGARTNNDGTNGTTITGPNDQSYSYTAASPFTDSYSNTLADVAMYYWKRDLRTDLDNEVPTTPANPAFWQHMVTFGVGLGVSGSVDPDTAFDAIGSGAAISWPDPTASEAAKLDDLLHAAVNSRGGFFSAADPVTFANELSDVLNTIVARVESSSTSAAASSATLQSDTLLYTAGFRSTDWSGQLQARHINANGSLGTTAWSAETKLREQSPGARNIVTVSSDTNSGVQLTLANLGAVQLSAINRDLDGVTDGLGGNRIAWLRGDETAHSSFRSRSGSGEARLLGDIINSNPQFAGKKNFGYRLLSDLGDSYTSFRNSAGYQARPNMLYLGANDGLLHGFDAATGTERFAYIPSELLLPEISGSFARINRLMAQDYSHKYFVDGTVAIGDAHWAGTWKTVLVGTMGAGGRTVFALDVTSPQSFGPANVLWEFTDTDLGYGVGQPAIVRMSTGEWAAVFGNGYNSANHRAMLFIVRLRDGQLLAKIDTGSGNADAPNGLAPPTAVLSMNDLSADTIYAGDLSGQLWRFKVSGNISTWANNSSRKVLFQARDSGGTAQPITAAPEVAILPGDPDKLIVTFGTGSYFRTQDDSSLQVQSLYGIVDDNGTVVTGRGQLLGQSITSQFDYTVDGRSYTLREVSDTSMTTEKGWYLDLIYGGNAQGERVVSRPLLLSGATRDRVRFSTLIPDKDPCATRGGRDGFVMDIMLASGGRADHPVFDLNGDGLFDGDDQPNGRNVSGLRIGGGEEMIVISDGDGQGHMYVGENHTIVEEPGTPRGRQSWRQIR